MAQLHLDSPFFVPNAATNPFRPVARTVEPELEGPSTYAMVQNGPPVAASEVEQIGATAIEVMLLWGDNVLHVEHLSPPRPFHLGEAGDYEMPAERLGATRAPLVVMDSGEPRVVVPAGATLTINGSSIPETSAAPVAELVGAKSYPLPEGASFEIAMGDLICRVGATAAGKRAKRSFFATDDRSTGLYFGLSTLAAAAMVAAAAFFVPPMGLTDDEGLDQDRILAIQQYLSASAERERTQQDTQDVADDANKGTGEVGEAAKGESGKMGKVNAANTNKRVGVKGPKDNTDPHLAREAALREASNFGLIGILNQASGDPNAPTVPWGRADSSGTDDMSALGNMWGDDIGESGGTGGLGLSGLGLGGGGRGEGIGMGMVGTCGSAVCSGLEHGFGSSNGLAGGDHKPKAPQVRLGNTEVTSGTLPAEVIQRIVRQNFGRFRMCYENGLKSNPNLAGRVAVRFVINRDGAVTQASNGGSDLPDSGVVGCVVSAYYGLSFPAPKDGIVTVNYPIMFSPGS
ncbi:MAG: AgmX/PglI C-terminal domain-containing protein [Myxococcales bacterium]|nr:AgmX/PglI C-terminal domain-containing protein [Myxococcales bacterium]MCB9581386.1 AgmX/PglI C-terminal domain-containing protein [Polyangiaceae bacterium]